MPIDLSTALGAELPSQEFSWTASDVALYALAVGAASDPMDTAGLAYVHDAAPKVLPSFATVAATPSQPNLVISPVARRSDTTKKSNTNMMMAVIRMLRRTA